MEEPGRLQSMGLQRVRHDRVVSLSLFLRPIAHFSKYPVCTWKECVLYCFRVLYISESILVYYSDIPYILIFLLLAIWFLSVTYYSDSRSVVPGPQALILPGNLLEMHVIGPHSMWFLLFCRWSALFLWKALELCIFWCPICLTWVLLSLIVWALLIWVLLPLFNLGHLSLLHFIPSIFYFSSFMTLLSVFWLMCCFQIL